DWGEPASEPFERSGDVPERRGRALRGLGLGSGLRLGEAACVRGQLRLPDLLGVLGERDRGLATAAGESSSNRYFAGAAFMNSLNRPVPRRRGSSRSLLHPCRPGPWRG